LGRSRSSPGVTTHLARPSGGGRWLWRVNAQPEGTREAQSDSPATTLTSLAECSLLRVASALRVLLCRMSCGRVVFRRESRRTLGRIRRCRAGHLLGRPREHTRALRFLRALVSPPRRDDRARVCRCVRAEVGSSPCLLTGLVGRDDRLVDDRRGGGESSPPPCGAHRSCSTMGTGRSRRPTSVCVNHDDLGQVRAREAPSSIRRSKNASRFPTPKAE
jgi:hypothetical protein